MPLRDQSHKETISQARALLSSSVGEGWELGILHDLWEAAQAQKAARAGTWKPPPNERLRQDGCRRAAGQHLLNPIAQKLWGHTGGALSSQHRSPCKGKVAPWFCRRGWKSLRQGRFINHYWGGGGGISLSANWSVYALINGSML